MVSLVPQPVYEKYLGAGETRLQDSRSSLALALAVPGGQALVVMGFS